MHAFFPGLTQTAFSPSGSLVNSSYAVLQAPFLMQRELENKLVTQAKNIPHWWDLSLLLTNYLN